MVAAMSSGCPSQLPLQLRDLGPKLYNRRPKLRVLRGKLLIGLTTIDRHHTMIVCREHGEGKPM